MSLRGHTSEELERTVTLLELDYSQHDDDKRLLSRSNLEHGHGTRERVLLITPMEEAELEKLPFRMISKYQDH